MTDGTPTDDPSKEFDVIRQRVESEQLFVFPLEIGESADMARLRNMYPFGKIPQDFSRRYCMVDPDDYRNIFNEIFQLSDSLKKRHSISGETGYALRNNKIDVPLAALLNHVLKPGSFSFCAGHSLIAVNAAVHPPVVALNHFTIITDLCGQRMQHGICCDIINL